MDNQNQEQFQEWKDNPQTKLFLKYLSDVRGAIIGHYAMQWANGTAITDRQADIDCGKCQVIEEIQSLDYEDIDGFYGEDK